MRKVLSMFLVMAIALGFGSCTKEAPNQGGQNPFYVPGGGTPTGGGGEEPEPADNPLANVGEVPADFVTKVLIEEFTGEWCGFCPDGAVRLEAITTANPNTAIAVGVHGQTLARDVFTVEAYENYLNPLVGVTGYPNGTVNRMAASGRGAWAGEFASEIVKAKDAGIAMEATESGGFLNLKVFIGYKTPLPAGAKLTVMITENNVPESSPGIQSGAPTGYIHQHLLRGLLTDPTGNDVDLTDPNGTGYTMVEFNDFDLSSLTTTIDNTAEAHIVVFAHSADGRTVYNVQQSSLTDVKKWD